MDNEGGNLILFSLLTVYCDCEICCNTESDINIRYYQLFVFCLLNNHSLKTQPIIFKRMFFYNDFF